jgi:hypothetical protein
MDNQNTPTNIVDEINKLDQLLSGLYYYAETTQFFDNDPQILICRTDMYNLDFVSHRAHLGQKALLSELQDIFFRFRARLLELGVEKTDVEDEKLLHYAKMAEMESYGQEHERIAGEKMGKTKEEIIKDAFLHPKIH